MTNRSRKTLAAAALVALALGASACSRPGGDRAADGGPADPGSVAGRPGVLLAALRTVGSCDALLGEIKTEALARVTPYGLGQPPVVFGVASDAKGVPTPAVAGAAERASGAQADSAAAASPAAPAGTGSSSEASSGATSGTNNQEQGVDEADLVKVSGNRLVVVHNDELRVIDTSAAAPTAAKSILLPGDSWNGELFIDGDRALVMTNTPGVVGYPAVGGDVATSGPALDDTAPAGGVATSKQAKPLVSPPDQTVQPGGPDQPAPIRPGSPGGRLVEVDLARGRVTRTLTFEGAYLAAREVEGSIRIVLSAGPARFGWVYPSSDKARNAALAANRALIEQSTIDQWLPSFSLTEQGSATQGTTIRSGPLVGCDRVHLPHDFAGFGSLVVATVHLDQGLDLIDATSVFTDAQTVYASPTTVAVATPRSPTYSPDGQIVEDPGTDGPTTYSTAVHTFDITDPDRATYQASGLIPGHLINQYALSERGGYLRAATTEASPWWGRSAGNPGASSITVLQRDGRTQTLRTVGQLGGLGKGQQIQAVRFTDDRAYVVTFRQTDPLYTIDLSDPARPVELGQLEIPGFSSYLHPLAGGRLLGVGTDGTAQGANGVTVVSLFDVHDPAHPTRVAKLPLSPAGDGSGGRRLAGGSSTPVATDARAFTFWQDRAVVPVDWWRNTVPTNGSAAVVVSVGADGTLQEIGRISHPQSRTCPGGVPRPMPIEGDGGIGSSAGGGTAVAPQPTDQPTGQPGIAPPYPCVAPTPQITRSVVVGNRLFTLSDAGVQVNQFDTLKSVSWIPFS